MGPMERRVKKKTTWGSQLCPLSAVTEPISAPEMLSEGPVRFLLISGDLDDGRWGLVGAFWLSIDGRRGGFVVAPESIWLGSEMVRCYQGAVSRGWTDDRIYAYWQGQVGMAGRVMVDPQQHADNLFQVARRVGAI
jgi:hypothetical protein